MEFPDVGRNCSDSTCKQLDFLPYSCSHCRRIFCHEHFSKHGCENASDARIPTCPICAAIIPVRPGEDPNIKVDEHISSGCVKVPVVKKAYVNECSLGACKKKELVPFQCSSCRKNFCIRHRHESDHNCSARSRSPSPAKKADEAVSMSTAVNASGKSAVNGGAGSTSHSSPSVLKSEPNGTVHQTGNNSARGTKQNGVSKTTNQSNSNVKKPVSSSSASSSPSTPESTNVHSNPLSQSQSPSASTEISFDRAQLDRERRKRQLQKAAIARAKLDNNEQLTEDEQMALALVLSEEEHAQTRSRHGASSTSQSMMSCVIS